MERKRKLLNIFFLSYIVSTDMKQLWYNFFLACAQSKHHRPHSTLRCSTAMRLWQPPSIYPWTWKLHTQFSRSFSTTLLMNVTQTKIFKGPWKCFYNFHFLPSLRWYFYSNKLATIIICSFTLLQVFRFKISTVLK